MTANATSKTTTKRTPAKRTPKAPVNQKAVAEKVALAEKGVEKGRQVARATKQDRALKAWEKGGRKGNRPSTPDLDAIESATPKANGKSKVKAAKQSTRSERGQKAFEARKAAGGKQANPKPCTAEKLETWIRATLKRDPNADREEECWYLRYVENLHASPARFLSVFDAVKAGKPVPAPRGEADAKKASAKKAPAKKATVTPITAASRKVTPPKATTAVRKSQKGARAKVRAAAGR